MSGTSLASSAKFRSFVIVFSISTTVIYVGALMWGFTPFSIHPATGLVEFGRAPPRRGEGPVMYWYGWVLMTNIGASVLGFLATLLPESVTRKIPVALVWLLPILALPLLIYSLREFWTK